ncbi:hypothetical protein C8Q79DRAFT_293828 [Trametes meyenii]|nr:hypothetical protein C8Q79DRAFT_293828 [Trametes meyenii]
MMFAKFTALLAIATAVVGSPVPAATPVGALPTDIGSLSSALAELPVPTGLAHLTPEKFNVNAAAVPTGTTNAPTAELLKPTEDLDIGGIISGLPIIGPILGPILGGLLGSLPIVGGLGLTLPSSTPVQL